MKNNTSNKHPFHLVDLSPWPILSSFAFLILGVGGVLYMHGNPLWVFLIGTALLSVCLMGWWRDVIKEAVIEKAYTLEVQKGLRYGVILFILTEVMFFFAFFWSFFDASLFPSESIGGEWPPKNVQTLDPFKLPYLNTLILLLSATSLTWSHESLRRGNHKETMEGLLVTIILGVFFSIIQAIEYYHATFPFKGNIYSANFYLLTGFHGVHVIVGTLFLSVCLWRAYRKHFTPTHHIGYEAAAWYWHFVDVVWLFLFVFIYWWGA